MGDVVLCELLKARNLLPKFTAGIDVFCLVEDEALRPQSLGLIQELRAAGLAVEYPLVPVKPDKQFKRAQELQAKHTVKLESGAGEELLVRIRSLATRTEQIVKRADAAEQLCCPGQTAGQSPAGAI
jgi:histidyl-tRNA synthetase